MRDRRQPTGGYGTLSEKQREVLDLLIEHKTSKEIARVLAISPHTVDQRINFSKQKLGAVSRGDLATEYRRQKDIYEQSIYEESGVDQPAITFQKRSGGDSSSYLVNLSEPERPQGNREFERIVPEVFEGRNGTIMRLGAIVGLAALLMVLILVGLAIFQALSNLLAS